VALTGPSGSGKTTVLRLVAGLLRPTAGEVRLDGRSLAARGRAALGAEMGYLPQNPDALLFAETVRAELAEALAGGRPARAGAAEVDELLATLGLAEEAERYPRDLSTGQRQRLALGLVAAARPPLLLLDEPTRGLDDAAIAGLAGWLQRRAEEGTAVLVASHDRRLVRAAQRSVVLVAGRLEAGQDPSPPHGFGAEGR
jgi:energy-coupling factor transport system ATP-binding protein